jgi:hypothetical protein
MITRSSSGKKRSRKWSPEDDREDHQAQLVHEIVLE